MQIRTTFPTLVALLMLASGPFSPLWAAASIGTGPSPERPVPIQKRMAWSTSRVTGSPEPPLAYRTERIFPKLKFVEPLEIVALPASDRFVLAEHAGKIFSFRNDPACESADIFADMKRWNDEIQEVYSVTFHPEFAKNRYVYIWYILKPELPEGTHISRFRVTETNPPRVDLSTEHRVITWKSGGHNGGCARFGKDGMLYISTGDGAGPDPPDTLNTGQDVSDLLSSILRIDVDHDSNGQGYRVPLDNPFIHTPGARPEIWAYGLRNPWRISIDQKTGDVWAGDVGWELWEMVYRVERGGNYGWSIMEGSRQQIKPNGRRGPTPILPPTFEHPHSEAASITGGSVYHGKRLPNLEGAYIYGDFETGKIWALRHDGTRVTSHQELADTALKIVSFGEDEEGELCIVDFNGTLNRLVPNPNAGQVSGFPRKLSETGIFSSTKSLRPAAGVTTYSINAEPWLDGALAQRVIALPGDSMISTTNSPWVFPKDAVLARTLSLPLVTAQRESARKVETQLLHFNGETWNAYTYRWNQEQTDAALVDALGAEQTFAIKDATAPGGQRQQTWRFASRAECLRCHNSWCGFVLGFNPPQLDRPHLYAASGSETLLPQLQTLAALRVLNSVPETGGARKLVSPHYAQAALDDRARSWLHVNCSHCHREHAGGAVLSFMNFDWPLEKLNLVGARPMQGAFGMDDAEVVAAGDPYRSVLYYRISKLGKGRMPYLGSRMIDEPGTALIHDWIESLPRKETNDTTGSQGVARRRAHEFDTVTKLGAALPAAERDTIIDRLLQSVSSALVLLHAITQGSLGVETRSAAIPKGTLAADRTVADLFERFVPEEQRVKTLGPDISPGAILALQGDAERGRKIFFQPGGAQCNTCHRLAGEGRDFGPDLSLIGKKYTRAQLLENIIEPTKTIDPKFVAYSLECKNGESHTGFLLKRDSTEVLIKDATGTETRVSVSNIAKLEAQKLSVMPEGLLQNLTPQEGADLLDFLCSLK